METAPPNGYRLISVAVSVEYSTTIDVAVPAGWTDDHAASSVEAVHRDLVLPDDLWPDTHARVLSGGTPSGYDFCFDEDGDLCEAPLTLPPDSVWFDWQGHRWANNGHVMVRSDLDPMVEARAWMVGGLTEKRLETFKESAHGGALVDLDMLPRTEDDREVVYSDQIAIGTEYAAITDASDRLVQRRDRPLGPVICYQRGEVVAYVMPRKRG